MASVAKREWTYKGETKSAWVVRYRDQGGNDRLKTFEKKKDADAYRVKIEGEMVRGVHVSTGEAITVRELCRRFVAHAETRHSIGQIGRTRLEQIGSSVRSYILPHLGARMASELTPLELENWALTLRREGLVSRKGGLAPDTLRGVLALVQELEDFAFKHGHMKVRVVGPAKKEIGFMKSEAIRTFNVEELGRVLTQIEQGAQGRDERNTSLLRCYVHLAAFCGLRLGEINALKPENIDLHRRIVKVRHSLTSFGELKGPKTGAGVRDVPLPANIADMLQDWATRFMKANELGTLFSTSTGEPLYRIDFNARWRRVLKAAGLGEGKSIHFHALRHFAASAMIEHGLPLQDVARLLGHRTFDMTLQVYAHPTRDTSRHLGAFDTMAGAVEVGAAPIRWPGGQKIPAARPGSRARYALPEPACVQGVDMSPKA